MKPKRREVLEPGEGTGVPNMKMKQNLLLTVLAASTAFALATVAMMSTPRQAVYGQGPLGITDTPRPPAPTSTPELLIPTATPNPGSLITPTPNVSGLPDPWVRLAGFTTCSAHDGYVDYVVGIGNDGAAADNVEVINAVSPNVEIIQIQPTRGTVVRPGEPNVFNLLLGTLAPGETAVISVRVRVLGGAGSALSALASVRTSTSGDDTLNNVRSLHCVTGNAPPVQLPTPAPLPSPGPIVPGEVTVIGLVDASSLFTAILLPETGGE
jgi:hypothetical protein